MSRVMFFIALKIVEVGGAFAVFTGLSFAHRWVATTRLGDGVCLKQGDVDLFCREIGFWYDGLMGLFGLLFVGIVLFICGLIITGLYSLIKKNWEWSGNIEGQRDLNRKKRR